MKSVKSKVLLVITLWLCAANLKADSGVESLSPDLRNLLAKEMVALEKGMQAIFPAYITGDFEQVAQVAKKIKESFILKQKITDDQKKELVAKLPNSFLKMDKKFHEYAGMLEHVARKNKTELVGFYYAKLTESCIACHSNHAKHRFPKLIEETKENEHHH